MDLSLCKTRGSAGTFYLVQCGHLVLGLLTKQSSVTPKTRKAELSYTESGQHLARGLVAEFLAEARAQSGTFTLRGNSLFPEAVPLKLPQHRMETALGNPLRIAADMTLCVSELELQGHRDMDFWCRRPQGWLLVTPARTNPRDVKDQSSV